MPGDILDLELICDGGRPLWPERWNLLRHGTYRYTVAVIGAEDATVEIGPVDGAISHEWYGTHRPKLRIDGREYARRRKARKRR